MKLKIKNKDGIILKTKNTVVTEDIEVVPDESIINGSGSYEDGDELIYGGEKSTPYGQVLVTEKKIDNIANGIFDVVGETDGQTLDELTTTLEGVNNEVTTQEGLIAQLRAAVDGLPEAGGGGGIDTSDATATAGDVLSGKTAYVNGTKITGTITTRALENPEIKVSSNGNITATTTIKSGYYTSDAKSADKQLTTKAATTYTPSTSNQTIAASIYLTGTQTIKGDANLVAGNIKSGVSIFGVIGNYTGSGGGGSSGLETCTVTLNTDRPAFDTYTISYINPNQEHTQEITFAEGDEYTCIKNSYVFLEGANTMMS